MLRLRSALTCLFIALCAFAGVARAAGVLVPRDGTAPIELRAQSVSVTVEDGLARTTVRQTFVNQHRGSLEAVYLFPIPEGAALVDVAMEVGGQRLEGLLVERQRARRTYNQIVRTQRDPALVEQIGRDRFRLSVFPVMPDQPTVVELTWIEHVPLTDGAYRYVYPLATGDGGATSKSDLSVTMSVTSSAPLGEVTCTLPLAEVIRKGEHAATMTFEESGSTLDQDITLLARVRQLEPRLDVTTFRGPDGDGYFAAVVTPPEATAAQILPRDITLVLDTSGSMNGEKMEQARAAALHLLGGLRPTDRVNVLAFSGEVRPFAAQPVPATPENLEQLRAFVSALEARGGTALGDALAEAVKMPAEAGRVNMIAFFTDGQPTIGKIQEPAQIVEVAEAGAKAGLRVFTFGVGKDVDSGLLRGIAAAGRGTAELFRPEGEVATRLTRFLQRTSSPVMANVELTAEGVTLHGVYPRPVPDLYLGEQMVLTGRYTPGGTGGTGPTRVSVRAVVAGKPVLLTRKVTFDAAPGGRMSVRDLFARQKLSYLEEALRIRTGLSDDAYFAALDKGAYRTDDEIVAEIVRLSLETGVQSAYTSFLVLLPEDRARLSGADLTDLDEARRRASQVRRQASGERTGTVAPTAGIEPEIKDVRVAGHDESDNDVAFDEVPPADDPRFNSDAPFEGPGTNGTIGIGGGAGGAFGGRRGGHRNLKAGGGGRKTETATDHGLEWLRTTQQADGSWDPSLHGGDADATVETSAAATLAFLGFGETHQSGQFKDVVKRALSYLKSVQHADGSFADGTTPAGLRTHAIATCAMSEAYGLTGSRLFKDAAQRGIGWLQIHATTRSAWFRLARGETVDAVTTAWITLAFKSARLAELEVDAAAFAPAHPLVDDALSSRPADDPWLAVAVLTRAMVLDTRPEASGAADPLLADAARRLADGAVQWDPAAESFDLDHWQFVVLASFQVGGDAWTMVNRVLKEQSVAAQDLNAAAPPAGAAGTATDAGANGTVVGSTPSTKGSWEPSGVRAARGGRIFSTALNTLALEVYYRYGKVVGSRK